MGIIDSIDSYQSYGYITLTLFEIQIIACLWWLKGSPVGVHISLRLLYVFSDGIWILGKRASFDPF